MVDDWDQPMFVLITVDEILDLESINHKENTLKAYNQFKKLYLQYCASIGIEPFGSKTFC